MNHYYWSIPAVCIMYILYGILTKQNNMHQTALWFWLLSITGAFPLWSFVSRVSKNLLMDGLLYDFFMLIAYVGTLIFLGEAKAFSMVQWLGMACCVTGLLLMKVGG